MVRKLELPLHRPNDRAADAAQTTAHTHERINVPVGSPWWAEHRSRYHFAREACRGKVVVDVACGTGFGAKVLLQGGAAAVLGIDMSLEALAEARRVAHERWDVCQADAVRLPLPDHAVSVVTSFETIEHLHQPERFVSELRRVLEPEGVLLLSTPNALYTKPVNGKPANPFHVREFTPSELRGLLVQEFGDVRLLGQAPGPRYDICPYWQLPEHLPDDLPGRMRVVAWKVQSRLPEKVREGLSQLVHHRSFYPGEHDFVFTETATETGHVLLAVCRP